MVLVACEESQEVCKRLREKGIIAFSCDILSCSGGHPEWHYKGNVLSLLNTPETFITEDGSLRTVEKWDAVIAFPPCTHLAVSGAAWFEQKRKDGRQRQGIEFFLNFMDLKCEKVVIENPIGIISGNYINEWFPDIAEKYNFPIKPTQIIHPWMFGDNHSKSTCLWIKGLPPLIPDITDQPELEWFDWIDGKTGKKKRQPKWFADAWHLPAEERARVRSKTFPGIAQAMADQWADYLKEDIE